MQFVDRAWARRFESAEEVPQMLHANWCEQHRPEVGARSAALAGGHMVFAGAGSPIGRAVGAGFQRPLTEDDFAELEEFYFFRHAAAQIDLCPLSDSSLLELALRRGYGVCELNNVLALELQKWQMTPAIIKGECALRRAMPQEAMALSTILRRCFFPDGGEPQGYDEMLEPMLAAPEFAVFVAEREEVTAVAVALAIREHGVLALFGAGTLPEYRGRGLQTALLQHRLKLGVEAGCTHAVIVTNGGSISQRNAERLGFHVAYSKATLIRQPPL